MRAYTVAATAVTLGTTPKWVDNVLSHHQVEGVLQMRQGIVRRVTPLGLLTLEVTLQLTKALKLPLSHAIELARRVISTEGGEVVVSADPAIAIRIDVPGLSNKLQARLDRALEMTPTPRRGRPASAQNKSGTH